MKLIRVGLLTLTMSLSAAGAHSCFVAAPAAVVETVAAMPAVVLPVAVSLSGAACGKLQDAQYWACHITYTDPCGGATGNPMVDVVTEWITMPECSKLQSKNNGMKAITNPDAAQKECMDFAYARMHDRGLGMELGEVGKVMLCINFGTQADMQKKISEYTAKVRSPKTGECPHDQISYDPTTNTLTIPGGCTYIEAGLEGLTCGGEAVCQDPVPGDSACVACAKQRCCEGYNRCRCSETNCDPNVALPVTACSCRLECEQVGALDGCQTCADNFGNPATNLQVLSTGGCLEIFCADECPLFLNY
jgi:hypothetical protein